MAPSQSARTAENILGRHGALVVDDEPLARAHLAHLLREAGVGTVGEAGDGPQALALLARADATPDWLFLDVRMPGTDGLAVADAALAAQDGRAGPPPAIVFVTGYEDYAVAAFERDAADYLLKPVARDRLAETLRRLSAAGPPLPAPPSRLPVRVGFTVRLVDFAEIVAANARDKRVEIITPSAVYPTYYTLADLERRLPADRFLRVHDGWIVDLGRVIEVHSLGSQSYQLCLRDGGTLVPVSRRRLPQLQRRLGL